MFERDLSTVHSRLVRGGIKPQHAKRIVRELLDHYTDIATELKDRNFNNEEIDRIAKSRLGDAEMIIDATLAHPELKSWAYRFPIIIFLLNPLLIYALSFVPIYTISFVCAVIMREWGINFFGSISVFASYILTPLSCFGWYLFGCHRKTPYLYPLLGILFLTALSTVINFDTSAIVSSDGAAPRFSIMIGLSLSHPIESYLLTTVLTFAITGMLVAFTKFYLKKPVLFS